MTRALSSRWLEEGIRYEGELLRIALDGSNACVVAPDLDYLSTPVLDEDYVYWVADRRLNNKEK